MNSWIFLLKQIFGLISGEVKVSDTPNNLGVTTDLRITHYLMKVFAAILHIRKVPLLILTTVIKRLYE